MNEFRIEKVMFICFLMFLPLLAQAAVFPDVPGNHWAYDAVEDLAAKGIITGIPRGGKTVYAGGEQLTRYQFAVALHRAMTYMEERSGGEPLILESETIDVPKKLPTLNEVEPEKDTETAKIFNLDDSQMKKFEQQLKNINVRLDIHERDILELAKRVQDLESKESETGITGSRDRVFWMAAGALLCSVAALLIAMGK